MTVDTTYLMPRRNSVPTDKARRCRIELYRANDAACRAIHAIDTDEQMKCELRNLFAVALRMALLANDGHLCERELLPW